MINIKLLNYLTAPGKERFDEVFGDYVIEKTKEFSKDEFTIAKRKDIIYTTAVVADYIDEIVRGRDKHPDDIFTIDNLNLERIRPYLDLSKELGWDVSHKRFFESAINVKMSEHIIEIEKFTKPEYETLDNCIDYVLNNA